MEEKSVENITVAVRVRPLNSRELSSGGESIWTLEGSNCIKEKSGTRSFAFDRIYNESSETNEIFQYQGVAVIEKCISGFNGCIFCYGQTGSGKTHTMHGVRKVNPGLVPLSIEQIFSIIQKSQGKEFLIRCSYIEIYNESINDLLNPNLLNLQLAEDKKILGVTEEVCTSSGQVNSLLVMGEKHKNVASTNFNQRSSRAHSIFRVIVESKNSQGRAGVSIAALNLIDLAGSESADVHGPAASTARSKEMKYINRSLLTLGTVIMRLSDKKNTAPIPYRDSKLTRLLQPALEGDSKVSIVCNISPCSDAFDETLSTLKFAQRAKKIKQTIVKNNVSDSKALIVKYENEIYQLQEKLREMETKMTLEENSAMKLVVDSQLILLQEEKEKADARLEGILQEKLQLQQDLERLKSFIIHAEDVKPVKMLNTENDERRFYKTSIAHSITSIGNSRPISGVFNAVPEVKEYEPMYRQESMLIKDIDETDFDFDGADPLKNISLLGDVGYPSLAECMKIIEDQAKMIESLKKNSVENQGLCSIVEEQGNQIGVMRKVIEDKDEELELIKDELKLCRNNLTKMKIVYKIKDAK